ncbi:hypothetical protein CsSME_00001167 [Camellia sinensis var. sinensis]
MSESQRFQLGTVGPLTLSVASSVLIVICNKALITALSFNFAVTGFGILNGISIRLLNLSLCFNSVGFYQLSLSILLLGVGVATVTDLQLNIMGSILSLLAVVTTCVAQIMPNTIQKKIKVSSTQLLYQSCPYQAMTLFFAGPFLDRLLTNQNVFAFKHTPQVLVFIVLSCLISVSVNFSTFLVIGKTSPVTYQVLGHLKTCLVLAFGYVLLHDPFSWRNIFGIVIALVGMVLYSFYCTLESQQKATEVLPQTSQSEVLKDVVATKAFAWKSNKDWHA